MSNSSNWGRWIYCPTVLFAVGRIFAFGPLGLPTAGGPQVRGEGVRQRMGDVPNQLVLVVPHDSHRIVHLDFMKRVRGKNRFVMGFVGIGQAMQPGLAMVVIERLVAVAVFFQGFATLVPELTCIQHVFRRVGFAVQPAGKIQQRRRDIDVADQRI